MQPEDKDFAKLDVSHTNVKRIRKQQKMSLKQMAEKTGMSASFLSNYENGKVNISVVSLIKIATVLGVPVAQLVEIPYASDISLVRKNERQTISMLPKTEGGEVLKDYLVRGIAPAMNVTINRLSAHTSTGEKGRHNGEEFIYVLRGVATVIIDDEKYLVRDGDIIYYSSTRPHAVANDQDGELEYLQTNTPPTF